MLVLSADVMQESYTDAQTRYSSTTRMRDKFPGSVLIICGRMLMSLVVLTICRVLESFGDGIEIVVSYPDPTRRASLAGGTRWLEPRQSK